MSEPTAEDTIDQLRKAIDEEMRRIAHFQKYRDDAIEAEAISTRNGESVSRQKRMNALSNEIQNLRADAFDRIRKLLNPTEERSSR